MRTEISVTSKLGWFSSAKNFKSAPVAHKLQKQIHYWDINYLQRDLCFTAAFYFLYHKTFIRMINNSKRIWLIFFSHHKQPEDPKAIIFHNRVGTVQKETHVSSLTTIHYSQYFRPVLFPNYIWITILYFTSAQFIWRALDMLPSASMAQLYRLRALKFAHIIWATAIENNGNANS